MQGKDTLVGKVLHATCGYNCTRNQFAIVVKVTPKTAQVLPLKTEIVSGDQTDGYERPIIPLADPWQDFDPKETFRVRNHTPDDAGAPCFWGRNYLWSIWDGKDKAYNSD